MAIKLNDYNKDGNFDMKSYLNEMNNEYNKRKRRENGIEECKTLREITDNKIDGHNFIILGTMEKALKMHHIAIYYAREEGVYVNVMEEGIIDFLNNKFKELKIDVRI